MEEEKLPEESLKKLCRACLRNSSEMKSLLSSSLDVINIFDMYTFVTKIQLDINEETPSCFCNVCEEKLITSYNFKNMCLKSDELIRNHISQVIKLEPHLENESDTLFENEMQHHEDPLSCKNENCNEHSECVKSDFENFVTCQASKSIEECTCGDSRDGQSEGSVTNESNNKEECHICHRRVKKTGFVQHTSRHKGLNQVICDICERVFANKRCLKIHMLSHTDTGNKRHEINSKVTRKRKRAKITDVIEEFKIHKGEENACDESESELEKNLDDDEKIKIAQSDLDDSLAASVWKAAEEFRKSQNVHTKCLFCSFESDRSKWLAMHMAKRHRDIKNWCSSCNEAIEENFEEHLDIHSNERVKCQFCQSELKKTYFIEHLKIHAGFSGVEPLICKLCNKKFALMRHLKEHLHRHTYSKRLKKVERINKTKIALKSRKNHNPGKDVEDLRRERVKRNLSEKNSENEIENEANLDLNDINIDEVIQTVIKTNYCRKCNRKFINLARHMEKVHKVKQKLTEKKTFSCNICGKTFTRNGTLRQHMVRHSKDGDYKCSYCSRVCGNKWHLQQHERIHTGERPHICNVCGKAFAQYGTLYTHMRTHEERQKACHLCDKKFCTSAELRLHILKHTGEKQFLCTECGKGFFQKSHLNSHAQIHSEETPFKCDQCGKAFKRSSSLKFHLMAHSGYKPLQCPHCSYACIKRYNLKQHMRRHSDSSSNDQQHVCQICGGSFTTKVSLQMHMKSVHSAIL